MRLLAIDDLLIDDASFYERPMITDRSNRLEWSTRRRQGVAGSVFFGGQAEPAKWNIIFKCNDLETRDAILAVLGGDVSEERRLLAIRDDVAQTRVIALAAPLKITEHNELDVSVDFEGSDSVWRSESADETTTSFTSALDQAMHLSVPGNTRTAPRIILTPQAQRTAFTAAVGFRYRRRYVVTNTADEPLYRYPLRISLGDTTPLTTTKAQADGDDVRVVIDGVEVERTLVTFDTSASYVWFIVEALPVGESMTVEVWYGNASATNPPVLAYPNLPAIILASSTNASWSYPIDDVAANKGLGTWHLSQTTDGPVADFTVPAAWRRVATLQTPDNQDNRFQTSYRLFTDTGTWALAGLDAWRSANGYLSFASGFVGLPQLNPYDGIGISHPLGLVSVTTTFKVINVNAVGRLVILMRDATSEDWTWLFTDGAVHATEATIASATYTPALPVHHLALAVWPQYLAYIPDDTVGYVRARLDASLVLAIDSSLISITGGTEEEIYELATELRIGGGQDRVAPYRSLLIGNARGEAGAGVPRCGVLLTQGLDIDCEERTHVATGRTWSPAELGSGLKAWFKADAISGVSDGVALAQWDDSSGNDRHATQAVAGDRPIYRAVRLNGLPGVEFVSSDYLATTLSGSSQDESVLAVVDVDSFAAFPAVLGPSNDGGRLFRVVTDGTLQYLKSNVAAIATSVGALTIDTDTMISGTLRTTTAEIGINGVIESFTHAQTLTASLSSILGGQKSAGSLLTPFDGDIHEIIITTALSAADRQKAEGYLAHKWGLTATLPNEHPYKSALPESATPVEAISAHAIRPIVGFDNDGVTEEGPSNLLLPLAPPRATVPNGTFDVDIGNWTAGTTTAGVTVARAWDSIVGGAQLGSLRVLISPNTAGAGAQAETVCTRYFSVNGRGSVEVAAWCTSNVTNVTPRLRIAWYDEDQALLSSATETDWTPVAGALYRRVFAARVPAGATFYRIVAVAYIDDAAAVGTVWFDDISTCDAELIVSDVAMGQLDVVASMQGRWLA